MELDAALSSIAENLREERTRAHLTLEQLAQRADLSSAHLSRIESGDRQPSLAALLSLSRALGITVSALLGEDGGGPGIALFQGDEPAHSANGLRIASCGGYPGSSVLEALQITIEVDRIPPTPSRHRGEEWIHVVRGCLSLEFDGSVYLLEPGSSVHFDADRPHRLAAHEQTTEVVVVAADSPSNPRRIPSLSPITFR
jgi:transcriptional regulator with XRE-family HTH domain